MVKRSNLRLELAEYNRKTNEHGIIILYVNQHIQTFLQLVTFFAVKKYFVC